MNATTDTRHDGPPPALHREVHILIGCSDARDVGGAFIAAIDATRGAYARRGVEVLVRPIRTPGSFVTIDAVEDLRRVVEVTERDAPERFASLRYFVHLQTHGSVSRVEPGAVDASLHALRVDPRASYNCGMLGATRVAVELEHLLLTLKPTIELAGGPRVIDSEAAVGELLRERYAHSGALAGDWIRSIDDLRTHPRLQETVLRRAINADRILRNVPIIITAGIQDYGANAYHRVDDRPELVTFWDEVYAELRRRLASLPSDDPEIAERTATQAPTLGLFSMGDILDARRVAVREFAARTGRAETAAGGPNTVFAFASGSFDMPRSPFGPYTIAGFYFAVAQLELRDFVVLAHSAAQARRMIARVQNDPLMKLITEAHAVRFHPIVVDAPTGGVAA